MAFDRDIGSVSIDVTTDEAALKAKIKAAFASVGPLKVKLLVDTEEIGATNAALQAEAKKTQTALTTIEEKGRADRKRDRLKENAAEIKAQQDLNRALVLSREKAAQEIARDQQKHAAAERKILEERISQEEKALQAIDAMTVKSFEERKTLRQKHKIQQEKAISDLADFEIREETKKTEAIRKLEAKRVDDAAKHASEIAILEKRQSELIRADKAKLANDLVRLDEAGKERQRRAQFTFNQRELLAQRAQQRQLELIIARSQAKMAAFGNKPIGLGILNGLTKINTSLVEFDRVASRVLKTSLLSFTVWSAGVAAAAGAAATAAIVSFAKFEQAVARASAVFASDQFTNGLLTGGQGLKSFASLAEDSAARVVKASNDVALTTLFNPREVAEGARALAQAGLTQREALDKTAGGYSNLATVAAFAQNEQLDFAAATEFLTGGLVSAGLEMGKLGELTDKFTTVANATNASAQQVAEAFANQGAAAFRAYGQSAEQALTVIGLLAKANERGLKAGTTAAILIREINNAAVNKAPEAFKKYGIAVGKVNGKTVPFTKTLTQITTLFRETEKREGSQGFAKLRKELGLTEKSLRGLILLTPQVAALGQPGVDRFTKIIEKSAGATQRQASVVTKTLSFQFQNLVESITIQFQHFGEAAGKSLAAVFDRFNGPDGIIKSLEPDVISLGEQFGDLISKFGDFVDSPEARQGALIILDAIKVTLIGVKDTFKEFASAFGEVESGQSAFVAFAKSVHAFAEVSATTLPIVAKAIGEIIDLLIDNKDAFEAFAKAAVALFVLRRAFALTVIPLKALTEGFIAAKGAATALAISSESGVIASGLGALATKIGFVNTAAIAARESLVAMEAVAAAASFDARAVGAKSGAVAGTTAASAAAARLGGRKAAGEVAAAKSARESARAFAAADSKFAKLSSRFPKFLPIIGEASIQVAKFAPKLLKFAGAVGVVFSIFEGGFKFVKGFIDGLKETTKESKDTRRGLEFLGKAAHKAFDALKTALPIVVDILEITLDVIGLIGKAIGRAFGDGLAIIVQFADAFDKLVHGDIIGAMEDFGNAFLNLVIAPIKNGLLFVLEAVENTLDKISNIPGVGRKFKDDKKAISEAIDEVKGFNAEFSVTEKASSDAAKAVEGSFKKQTDSISKAVGETKKLNAELSKTTAGSIIQQTLNDTQNQTQKLIDVYRQATSRGPLARALRDSLGISREQAQTKLTGLLAQQLKEVQESTFSTFQKKLSDAGPITPEIKPQIDKEAFQTINAQIHILQQKREAILELGLPKDQQTKLVTAVNKEIVKLRSFVHKNPVRIQFEIGGQAIGTGQSIIDETFVKKRFLDPIRDAIRSGDTSELTDAQLVAFRKATEDVQSKFGAAGAFEPKFNDSEITLAIGRLEELARVRSTSRIAPKVVEKDFFSYAQAAATGLLLGAQSSKDIAKAASDILADTFLNSFKMTMGIFSPSTVMIEQGKMIDQGLADGIRAFQTIPEMAAFQAGQSVMHFYALGIIVGGAEVRAAAIEVITTTSKIISDVGFATALAAGTRYMQGFKSGLVSGFGTPKDKGSIAWYLNVFIPQWIKDNKGPVSYDAQILVPAGEAVMAGFGRGLRSGFAQIQGFVSEVGPALSEFVTQDAFSGRTAEVMADIAVGKTPDINKVFEDMRPPDAGFGFFGGILDPTLAFLHKTLSLADTIDMGEHLGALFNLHAGPFREGHSTFVNGTNRISDHAEGIAGDFSNGTTQPDPSKNALFAAVAPLIGKIFKQIIYKHERLDYKGNGSYSLDDHMNHVHIAWLRGQGFDVDSGKKGEPAGISIPGVPPDVSQAIAFAAAKTHLDPLLIAAVMQQESGFDKNIVSYDGGYGLMQLTSQGLVDAADRLGGRFDPKANTYVGAKYLADLISQLGSTSLGLSAYNSGPAGGEQYGSVDVPGYVSSVLGILADFRKKFGGFREHGGPVDANTPYIVGERGPELMFPRTNGTIVNARDTAAMMNGNMGKQIHVTQNNTIQTNATQPAAIMAYLRAHTQNDLATLAGV